MAVQEILFRKTSTIPNSGFGIFSLYKYPAKFIPQVPAFVLENYAKKGMRVFDPFAGFGTVGFTARSRVLCEKFPYILFRKIKYRCKDP